MAPMIFTKAILEKKPLRIFNNGDMNRDFTYIDDVIEAILRLINKPAVSNTNFNKIPDPSSSWSPHRIFNIGNSNPVSLMRFINIIENELQIEAIKVFEPMQQGDVKSTYADTSKLKEWINYKPNTSLEKGIKNFITWYKSYYQLELIFIIKILIKVFLYQFQLSIHILLIFLFWRPI